LARVEAALLLISAVLAGTFLGDSEEFVLVTWVIAGGVASLLAAAWLLPSVLVGRTKTNNFSGLKNGPAE
jgi:hypothetical protein